jgi:glycosyltransferase involved in cell wall biosynthesis
MNILVYCFAFSPSIGGIEIVTETLARKLTELGNSCIVITETQSDKKEDFPFQVVRRPNRKEILHLMKWSDVVCNVELSMKFFLLSKIARRPLFWIHNGYKLSCIDAFGWFDNEPAPINPWQSIKFYAKKRNALFALKEGFKLYCRRWASSHIKGNIAGSEWIAWRQPLRRQTQIYTPFPVDNFIAIENELDKKYDFVFLGRLVKEKGVETLLHAIKILVNKTDRKSVKLAIIGYGAAENYLKEVATKLQVEDNVHFLGPRRNEELMDIVSQCEIAVIPSHWEEPMGGAALQLMAAGRIMIVSSNGGLKEVVGKAGLTFKNGNAEDLALKMEQLLGNEELKITLRGFRKEQLKKFDPDKLTKDFVELFSKSIRKKKTAIYKSDIANISLSHSSK